MQAKQETQSEALHGDLGKRFDFTEADLDANRGGLITERQKESYKKRVRWNFRVTFLLLLLLSNFWIYFFIQMIYPAIGIENASLQLLCFSAAVGSQLVLLAWASFGTLQYQFNAYRDLKDLRLEKISGQVRQTGNRQPSLYVGDKEMPYRQSFHGYPWGDSLYTVYYLPRTKEILSVEEGKQNAS